MRQQPESRGTSAILCLILLICIVGLGTFYAARAMREGEAARQLALEKEAGIAAAKIASFVQPAIDATLELARLVEAAKAAGSGRDIIRGLAVPTLQTRSEFVGVSVVFEPNGFDGKDSQFQDMEPEQDTEGRFVPYYYNTLEGRIETVPLAMTIEAGIENWYLVPLREGRPQLLAPYSYPINGIDVFMTTVSAPLMAAGTGFGITTVDFQLTDLPAAVQAMKPLGVGEAWVLSDADTWVAHPDNARIGQELFRLGEASADPFGEAQIASAYLGYLASKRAGLYRHDVIETGTQYLLMPISFIGVPQRWTLVFHIPAAGVWAERAKVMALPSAITIGAFLFGIAAGASRRGPARPAKAGTRSPTVQRR